IAGVKTPASMRRLLNLMVGELDASHSGVRSPHKPDFYSGRLGLQFDPTEYESSGQYRITSIVPLSAADVSGKIHVGDRLTAVNGTALNAHVNLARLLAYTSGRKTRLTLDGKHGVRHVEVKPISSRAEADLAYAAWTQSNRAYVNRISHGRLGYVHLRDMSMGSLQRFYKDLDANNSTREGVVIDDRNNFGGFVNAYVLDVLSRKPYLNMTFRGFDKAQPARTILGQRALERPTVLVTNRVTLSDGEDFSEGYRALGLGKIVGEPTAGWIIYTSNVPMIDGSVVRLPFITVTDNHGQPMELHPRPVDVAVSRSLGESYRHVDTQLDAAVTTLVQQLDSAK
ncbi:MAG: S41 family peptidase, partial [Xanthomonadales bacterium]|nr:S41 family peptidase [Xanthomonadales bacterium]